MIGRLEGRLLEKNPPSLLVDVNGVGYEVDVPMSTFYQLPAISERVVLLTHLAIREDAHQLYGFATAAERAAFRELIKISGVGARTALSKLVAVLFDLSGWLGSDVQLESAVTRAGLWMRLADEQDRLREYIAECRGIHLEFE